MGARFSKTVKNAKRGVKFSKKFKHRFIGSLVMFLLLLFGSAYLVWIYEKGTDTSYTDAIWSVLFTLIGQGEFATSPTTPVGRILVFFLSIFGVALFGVVFAEVMQRLMNSKLKEMLGMSVCKFDGHVMICGWNTRGPHLVRQLMASGRRIAVIAEEKPAGLNSDIFFVQGIPSERESLIRGGIEKAKSAIILWDPKLGDDDSRAILTGLAVESIRPEIYTVMELHNPENERYARYAHVDDLLYTDSLIADITAMCTHYEGISSFIRDILCADDDGHRFASFDIPDEYNGKTVAELFEHYVALDMLPVGIIVPPESGADIPVSEWVSRVNPPRGDIVSIPAKVVCIKKNEPFD